LVSQPVEIAPVTAVRRADRAAPVPVLVDFWAPWCGPVSRGRARSGEGGLLAPRPSDLSPR
jgi:thiol-disulfide isomerase/thioredoxin